MNLSLLAGAALLGSLADPSSPAASTAGGSDELRRERLPADVDFVVHFDLEGFKQTDLWRHLAAAAEDEQGLAEDLDELEEFQERYGIDPLTDVRAVTLFKVASEEDPTVVLVSTTPVIDEALKRFQAAPGYARVKESGIELHTWSGSELHLGRMDAEFDEDEHVFAYLHAGSGGERVVVLASNKQSALRAARVLRGDEPNHVRGGTLLTIAPARGSFLYVAAANIPKLSEYTPASQVFGLAQGIQVDLGEAGGFLQAHMGLRTRSPEDAVDIFNVINGVLSLARLAGAEAGEALELLTGIRLNTHGSEVMLEFEYGVERLLELFRSLDEESDEEPDEESDEHEAPEGRRR